jgi:ribosomal protein S7
MRKKRAEIRRISPDPKYNDVLVAKLINYMMYQGKKSTATRLVYDSFEVIKEKLMFYTNAYIILKTDHLIYSVCTGLLCYKKY